MFPGLGGTKVASLLPAGQAVLLGDGWSMNVSKVSLDPAHTPVDRPRAEARVRNRRFGNVLGRVRSVSPANEPYIVQRGDTLWKICARKLAELEVEPTNQAVHAAVLKVSRANRLENPDLIMPGQRFDLSAIDGVRPDPAPRKAVPESLKATRPRAPEMVTRSATAASRLDRLIEMVLPARSDQAVAALSNTPSPWSQILGGPGRLTSVFGMRNDPFTGLPTHHDGLDIAAEPGTTVYPLREGRVTYSGWKGGYGQMVVVDHGDGVETVYGHTSKNMARVGQWVHEDTPIAEVGSTGRSTGPHLHFEARRNDRAIDPIHLITQGSGSLVTHVAKVFQGL